MSLVFYVYTQCQHLNIFSPLILNLSLSLDSFFLSVLLVDFFSCLKDKITLFFLFASNKLLSLFLFLSPFVPQEQSASWKAQC